LRTDPNCNCINCIVTKIRDAIDEPIPNIMKCQEELFRVFNTKQKMDFSGGSDSDFDTINNLFKKIDEDLFNNLDDVKQWLDLIDLKNRYLARRDDDKFTASVHLKGLPNFTPSDRRKRHLEKLKTQKQTIFDSDFNDKNNVRGPTI